MLVEDDVDRRAMVAANKSRIKGIIDMPTTIVDSPQERGGMAVPKTGKGRLTRNVDTVARKAITKASAGERRPIRINLDRAKPNTGIGSARIIL